MVFSVKSVSSVNPVPAVNPVLCTWNSVKRHYEIILEGSGTFHEANLCKLEYVDTAYVTCIKIDNMIYVKRIYYLSSKQQFSLNTGPDIAPRRDEALPHQIF